MNKIEIPLSKTKLLLGSAGSVLFVLFGLYYLITMADQQTRFNPTMVKGVGIASILFFGATGIYGIKKIFDKTIGLTIDENGIFDNTNASSIGLIKWTDITAIKTEQVASTKFLLIYTSNPDFYLDKVKGFKRRLMEENNRLYGTPLSITSNTLKYNFNDLEKIINDRFDEQRKKAERITAPTPKARFSFADFQFEFQRHFCTNGKFISSNEHLPSVQPNGVLKSPPNKNQQNIMPPPMTDQEYKD